MSGSGENGEELRARSGIGMVVARVLVGALVLGAAFSYAFVPLRASQDEWWHLKAGRWIVENRRLPVHDIFTWAGADYRWYNHEWLSQVIFWEVFAWGAGEEARRPLNVPEADAGRVVGDATATDAAGAGESRAPRPTMTARPEAAGVQALVAFKALVVTLTFALVLVLARQRGAPWGAALLVTFLAAEMSRRTIYPRPPIFSYLFMAAFLWTLTRWKMGQLRGRWLWALMPATVVWANLHGMVLLAIVMVGAFFGGELLEWVGRWVTRRWVGRKKGQPSLRDSAESRDDDPSTEVPGYRHSVPSEREPGEEYTAAEQRQGAELHPVGHSPRPTWQPLLQLGGLLLGVTLAAMAQPSGYHLFFLGRNFTADPILQSVINEMLPPPWMLQPARPGGPRSVFVPGFATFWIAASLFLLLLAANRGRLQFGADYLLSGFFLFQAANHWRLLPLFALAAAAPAAWLIGRFVSRRNSARSRTTAEAALLACTAALPLLFVFRVDENGTFWERNQRLARGGHADVMDYASYPRPLMDYLVRADLPGPMISEINYIGYPIWRLSPERMRVFTDNRFDLFGSRFQVEEFIVFEALNPGDRWLGKTIADGWRAVLEKYGINLIVASRGREINRALHAAGGWQLVHYYVPPGSRMLDGGFNVWLRESPETSGALERARDQSNQMRPAGSPTPDALESAVRQERERVRLAAPHPRVSR